MRRASQVLFFIVIGGLIWGFSVRPSDAELGNKIIGFSVLAGAFVFMPRELGFHEYTSASCTGSESAGQTS